jgi:hypothetical protein
VIRIDLLFLRYTDSRVLLDCIRELLRNATRIAAEPILAMNKFGLLLSARTMRT